MISLAERLGLTIHQVRQMPIDEYVLWHKYFSHDPDQKSPEDLFAAMSAIATPL